MEKEAFLRMFISNKPSSLSNIDTYERTKLEVDWESPSFISVTDMYNEYNNIQAQYKHFLSKKSDTSTNLPKNKLNNNVDYNIKSKVNTN